MVPGPLFPEIVLGKKEEKGFKIIEPTFQSCVNFGDVVTVSLFVDENGKLINAFDKLVEESGFFSIPILLYSETEEHIEEILEILNENGFTVNKHKKKVYIILSHILIPSHLLETVLGNLGFKYQDNFFIKEEESLSLLT